MPDPPAAEHVQRPIKERLLAFAEHPLTLTVFGIIGGAVGLAYPLFWAVVVLCLVGAWHRSGAAKEWSPRAQVVSYLVVIAVSGAIAIGVNHVIRTDLHIPTAGEIADEIIKRRAPPISAPRATAQNPASVPSSPPAKIDAPPQRRAAKRPSPETLKVVRISRLEPMPFVIGQPPEVRLHIEAKGSVPVHIGVEYDSWILRTGSADDFQERTDLEDLLWSQFMNDSAKNKPAILAVPTDQDRWVSMFGKDAITDGDLKRNPPTVRYYFLAKIVNKSGRTLAESCFYFLVTQPSYTTDCVSHID